MQIKQWADKNLSQFSYGILSDDEKTAFLIDPSRDTTTYLAWADANDADIIGVIETHPHADFVSGHLELLKTAGARIYVHSLVGAAYPHTPLDDNATIEFGEITLKALHTPGHSPDSICILLTMDGEDKAVFTGDTLFIGDCGRPDLREGVGNIQGKREELAKQLYHSLRNKLINLSDDVIVYPGHGAGSLCGKNLGKESTGTIGNERKTNWSLQPMPEEQFVSALLADLPFVPLYFPHDVEVNRKGAPDLEKSVSQIVHKGMISDSATLDESLWVVDAREEGLFSRGHLAHSINIMEDGSFETWLGTLVAPKEKFYLACEDQAQINRLIKRVAAIGYESQIQAVLIPAIAAKAEHKLDLEHFRSSPEKYTIVDVRGAAEVEDKKIFETSINIPLTDILARVKEIPVDKPIVVHCASGYRSAVATSIIGDTVDGSTPVYNLGEAVSGFM